MLESNPRILGYISSRGFELDQVMTANINGRKKLTVLFVAVQAIWQTQANTTTNTKQPQSNAIFQAACDSVQLSQIDGLNTSRSIHASSNVLASLFSSHLVVHIV
jgi:hypothetical protein